MSMPHALSLHFSVLIISSRPLFTYSLSIPDHLADNNAGLHNVLTGKELFNRPLYNLSQF